MAIRADNAIFEDCDVVVFLIVIYYHNLFHCKAPLASSRIVTRTASFPESDII